MFPSYLVPAANFYIVNTYQVSWWQRPNLVSRLELVNLPPSDVIRYIPRLDRSYEPQSHASEKSANVF